MTKEEWIDRCAERFHERGGVSMSEAVELATTCFDAQEDINGQEAYTPEDSADEEMSYWDEPMTGEA